MCDHTCPLMIHIYDELSDSMGPGAASFGTDAHMQEVWAWARHQLLREPEGVATNSGRWLSLEVKSRLGNRQTWLTVMVLLWTGWRRFWFKSFADSPLHARQNLGRGEASEAAAAPLPAEAALADDGAADAEGDGPGADPPKLQLCW